MGKRTTGSGNKYTSKEMDEFLGRSQAKEKGQSEKSKEKGKGKGK